MRHRMGHGFEPPVLSITVSVSWLWRAKSKVRLFSALSQCSFSSTFKALCCIRSVHSVVSCFSRPSYTFSQALVCLALLLLLLNVRNEVLSNYKLTRIPPEPLGTMIQNSWFFRTKNRYQNVLKVSIFYFSQPKNLFCVSNLGFLHILQKLSIFPTVPKIDLKRKKPSQINFQLHAVDKLKHVVYVSVVNGSF